MPVYAKKGLQHERHSIQLSSRQDHHLSKQRDTVLRRHARLLEEFQRQSRLHEFKKKERYSTWFPPLFKETDEQKSPQILSTFCTNIKHFRPIKKRVSSAEIGSVICDRRYVLEDSRLCRHFCELLGPNLCIDCTRLRERLDAASRKKEEPVAPLHLERDPFATLVSNHYNKQYENDESDEEVIVNDLSDNEDLDHDAEILRKQSPVSKVYCSPSPPWRVDSGYSSRMSYINDLTRPQSCVSLFRSIPTTPSIPFRNEKTRILKARKQNYLQNSSDSPIPEISSDIYRFAKTLEKLQMRKAENLSLEGKWPESGKGPLKSWQKSPVEPILMELKLINFTQYDKLGYEPLPPEPEPPTPVIPTDEFGFPLMDKIQISSM